MFTKKTYSTFQMARWTRFETFLFLAIITCWVVVYYIFDLSWLKIPWTPLSLIGTAVAFVIGFQNSAAYGRIWEARKIWGGIVNSSRTFGAFIQDMVNSQSAQAPIKEDELQEEIRTLTYRHIAWLTALRYAMRESKPWETIMNHRSNQEWDLHPPEKDSVLEDEIKSLISEKDYQYVMSKSNKQTAFLRSRNRPFQ